MSTEFNEVLENKSYPELSGYLSEGMTIKEAVKGDRYSALIKSKDSNKSLRTSISEGRVFVTISESGTVLEKYSTKYESPEDMAEKAKTAVETYKALDDIEDFEIPDDEETDTVLTEEPVESKFSSIEMGLAAIKDSVQSVADDAKALSDMTSDVEMITVIMDIANNLYATALDIEDATETYKELKGEDSEEEVTDVSEEA